MIHTFRVVVVGRDSATRSRLGELLGGQRDFDVVAEADSGAEGVRAIEARAPDVVFLGVQLPKMDAFEVLERVSLDRLPIVVFVSPPEAPALPALEASSADYLLEPVEERPFLDVLRRLRRALHSGRDAERMERLLALIADPPGRKDGPSYVRRLVVREDDGASFLPTEDIVWIEAAGNYVRVHSVSGSHLLRTALAELEQKLDPDEFARIHRSMIVNLSRVEAVRQGRRGEHIVVVEGGHSLKLSRGYRGRVPREVY